MEEANKEAAGAGMEQPHPHIKELRPLTEEKFYYDYFVAQLKREQALIQSHPFISLLCLSGARVDCRQGGGEKAEAVSMQVLLTAASHMCLPCLHEVSRG